MSTQKHVNLKIYKCEECPHVGALLTTDPDGEVDTVTWVCNASNKKEIATFQWADEAPEEIPDWCPLLEE